MKRTIALSMLAAAVLAGASVSARADEDATPASAPDADVIALADVSPRAFHVDFLQAQDAAPAPAFTALKLTTALAASDAQAAAPAAPRAVAVDYSDAYMVRAKIHRYSSWATLPLFIANYYAGDQLYDGSFTEGQQSFHSSMVAASAVLFGVNSVTGVWNLWEGRKDPNHRKRRMIHGIMMLAADAGFMMTGATAPDFEEGKVEDRSTHRSLAITSMGIATASYLFMLFAR